MQRFIHIGTKHSILAFQESSYGQAEWGSGQPHLVAGNAAHSRGVGTTRSLKVPSSPNYSVILG